MTSQSSGDRRTGEAESEGSPEQPPRQPRTGGDVGLGPIQLALALLVVFLALLVLAVLWPILTGA